MTFKQDKTQQDMVNEQTETRPDSIVESMNLPGLVLIKNMSDNELYEFLYTVVRARPSIYRIELSLGNYQVKDETCRISGANQLYAKTYEEAAKVLTMMLLAGPKVAGFDVSVSASGSSLQMDGATLKSAAVLKMANKAVKGPSYDEDGKLVDEGDAEFNPQLILHYRPAY